MAQEKQDTSIRKEQIMFASANIIRDYGVRGLSISNIAKEIGLVPSAIYRHFKSKNEILKEIVKVFSQKLNSLADIAATQEVNPLSRIKKILNMHVQLLIHNRFFPMLMFSEEVFLDEADVKKDFMSTIGMFLGRIGQNFKEAIEQGLIRDDLSIQNLTMMYMGMFLPVAASLIVLGQEVEVLSLVESSWEVFQNGVIPK